VAAVPPGWNGYFALYDGPANTDPGCPADYPSNVTPAFVGNGQFNNAPAKCTACKCSSPNGGTCTLPDAFPDNPNAMYTIGLNSVWIADAPCGQQLTYIGTFQDPAMWDGTCTSNGGGYQGGTNTCGANGTSACNQSVNVAPAAVTGATCSPMGGAPSFPSVWDNLGRGCGDVPMTAKGCNGGQVCLPKPVAPYVKGTCIASSGVKACPAGSFSDQHIFYQGVANDTRSCTQCSCNPATGGTCGIDVTIYADQSPNTCATPVATASSGSCTNFAGNPYVIGRTDVVTKQPSGGTCAATGGQATGSVSPDAATATTYCCIP
jgi:hypothetical protein